MAIGRAQEVALLGRINCGLSAEERHRYEELVAKRRAEALTEDGHSKLILLSDAEERIAADRLAALVELAQLRQLSLGALIEVLGLRPMGGVVGPVD